MSVSAAAAIFVWEAIICGLIAFGMGYYTGKETMRADICKGKVKADRRKGGHD